MSGAREVAPFPVPPLVKEVRVAVAPEEAFRRFTEAVGRWWPLASHSVAQADAVDCAIEPRTGGRVFERDRSGREHEWGIVELWAPPCELAIRWFPGRDPEQAQHVHVRFEPAGADATLVVLVHEGWERLGEAAAEARRSYEQGWPLVLRNFAEFVEPGEAK